MRDINRHSHLLYIGATSWKEMKQCLSKLNADRLCFSRSTGFVAMCAQESIYEYLSITWNEKKFRKQPKCSSVDDCLNKIVESIE